MAAAGLEQIDLLKLDIKKRRKRSFLAKIFNRGCQKPERSVIELHDWITPGCSKPFFTAINTCFENYSYKSHGENMIILNEDLLRMEGPIKPLVSVIIPNYNYPRTLARR